MATEVSASAPPATLATDRIAVPRYEQVPETKHDLDWADLVSLDLSEFDTPGGKQRLAAQLYEAIQKIGFFYIVNFGLTQEQIDHQFSIGNELFKLPTEEKLKYRADLEHGNYNGYKPLGTMQIQPGVRDNIEMYNIFKFIPYGERSQPQIITQEKESIEYFARHIHQVVVKQLLTLIAIILELPENYFVDRHRYDAESDCHLRYMKYTARSPEENAKLGNVWSKGHTDFGSLTLLFRQPVAALQVKTQDAGWKYVKPLPGSITVNVADTLQFWTNGFLKSSVHRVIPPPEDQQHINRLGVLYFLRPENDQDLKAVESPVLKRLGLEKTDQSAEGIKGGEWVKARVAGNLDAKRAYLPDGEFLAKAFLNNLKPVSAA